MIQNFQLFKVYILSYLPLSKLIIYPLASWICFLFFVLHWLTKNLFVTKWVWFQAKSRQWEIWKTQLFWFFPFLYQKLMNALVESSGLCMIFYQKSGLTQSWMGNLRPQKILDWPLILSEVSHCPTCCSPTASGGHCAPPLGSPWPPKRSKTMHKSIWRVFLWGCSLQNQRQLTSLLLICSTLYGKGIEERRPATRRRAAASSGGGAHWWLLSLKKVS